MNDMQFLDIGFSHFIEGGKIIDICKPGSSPIRKQLARAKEEDRHIDCTEGKKTRSIIFSSCEGKIILTSSTVQTGTLVERINRLRTQDHFRELSLIRTMVETTIEQSEAQEPLTVSTFIN